jgi:hypothetical protein
MFVNCNIIHDGVEVFELPMLIHGWFDMPQEILYLPFVLNKEILAYNLHTIECA